jgi:hypothetical protein
MHEVQLRVSHLGSTHAARGQRIGEDGRSCVEPQETGYSN